LKVTIVHGGTIVPILVTTKADTELLEPEPAEQLRQLVAAVGPLDEAPASGPTSDDTPAAQPDRGAYRVTIDDGDTCRTAVLREHDLPPSVQALIDFVVAAPGASAQTGPAGAGNQG
jgi:hypothetical protein